MGYDAPKEKQFEVTNITLSSTEIMLLKNFNALNDLGMKKVITYSKDLLDNPKYKKDYNKILELPKNTK